MKAELTDISTCKKSFDIEIPEDVVTTEISHISQNLVQKARVPGFRPGKAPSAWSKRGIATKSSPRCCSTCCRDTSWRR